MNTRQWIIIGSVLGVVLILGGLLLLFDYQNQVVEEKAKLPPIGENEADPAVWGLHYPRHYDSYLRNYETSTVTTYGGSVRTSKLEKSPYLLKLYAGYGFAEEYNMPRGHVYSLQDIIEVNPARKTAGSVCITCKTAEAPALMEKYGDDYYLMTFDEIITEVSHPIACLDCHDPKTMELRISRPALVEAFERQGRDITEASRQEMRTLVCAQCHVEYYFYPETKKLTFPWDLGTDPEDVERYFDEMGFVDWVHPESGTPMIKAQHPDYEFFLGSTHESAGLSCADCHMPYVTEGNVKVTSHWWTSPLKHMEQSCMVCHRESAEWLESRVLYTQDRTYELIVLGGETISRAIDAIQEAANTPGHDVEKLEEARALHRSAQWYWDWMSSENSMGFHNPQKALSVLAKSIALGNEALLMAREATR